MAESKTILVIDDDLDFVEFCQSTLESAGYTVVTAFNTESALAAAETHKPGAIILDIIMDTPDAGFEVARKLGSTTPILMLSAIASAADGVFDTSSLPITDLVDKPIGSHALLEKIAALLGKTMTRPEVFRE